VVTGHGHEGHYRCEQIPVDIVCVDRLRVVFDALPLARWGPVFQVLCLERPDVCLEWRPIGFPTSERSLLESADVGLFVAPPREAGLSALTLETSQMVVTMAVGHRLAQSDELSVADILDEPFPGGPNHHPEWRAFWTLDEQRGGPPESTDDDVDNAEQGLQVVASGRAIGTVPASIVSGLPHPGVVAVPLRDGPPVATRLVWRSQDQNPIVHWLAVLAAGMTGNVRGNGRAPEMHQR
jgi:DNA-binding transcriptional LysR family regulator